jgi:glutathione S-transferase
MKLLGSPGSPYVRKVRIVLAEKRVDYEYVIGRPSAPDSRIHEYNPLGKIPVLVRDDGSTIYDSVVIVEYLEGLVDEPRLIPAAFEDRIQVKRWEALGDGIADATVAVSHDLREPEAQRKPEAWYVKQRQKISAGSQRWSAILAAMNSATAANSRSPILLPALRSDISIRCCKTPIGAANFPVSKVWRLAWRNANPSSRQNPPYNLTSRWSLHERSRIQR